MFGVMKSVGLLCGALLVGCSHSAPPSPDSNTCTSGSGCGLFVPWTMNPQQLPSTLSSNTTLETATFRMASLRVIGDAGSSDPRTTQDSFTLAWSQGQAPNTIAFATAPSGLYSKVSLSIDGGLINDSYLFTGHAVAYGTTYPFVIRDAFALAVDLSANAQLDPGTATTIPIKIDLASAIGQVNWNIVVDSGHLEGGVLTLDTDDEFIQTFEKYLIQSFSIETDR